MVKLDTANMWLVEFFKGHSTVHDIYKNVKPLVTNNATTNLYVNVSIIHTKAKTIDNLKSNVFQ